MVQNMATTKLEKESDATVCHHGGHGLVSRRAEKRFGCFSHNTVALATLVLYITGDTPLLM